MMAATPYNPTGEYQPKSTIGLPALYAWPRAHWHDGSRESLLDQKERLRKLRRQST